MLNRFILLLIIINNFLYVLSNYEDICKCSTTFLKPKVFNGTLSKYQDFNWVVGIYNKSSRNILCTGNLLSASKVLIAATCLKNVNMNNSNDLQVIAGSVHFYHYAVDTYWGSRKIKSFVFNPKYIKGSMSVYDLAILNLKEDFVLGSKYNIYPACILSNEIDLKKSEYYFAGYGAKNNVELLNENQIKDDLKYSLSVNYFKLKYTPNQCKNKYREFLCFQNPSSSVCYGDIGGGFHIPVGDKLVIFGIAIYSQIIPIKNKNFMCLNNSTVLGVKISMSFLQKEGKPLCLVNF